LHVLFPLIENAPEPAAVAGFSAFNFRGSPSAVSPNRQIRARGSHRAHAKQAIAIAGGFLATSSVLGTNMFSVLPK